MFEFKWEFAMYEGILKSRRFLHNLNFIRNCHEKTQMNDIYLKNNKFPKIKTFGPVIDDLLVKVKWQFDPVN